MEKDDIKVLLEDNFILDDTSDDLINFIYAKENIKDVLKTNKYISSKIEKENNIRVIKLFQEGPDWKTIFIEINVELKWDEWSKLNDEVLEYMFDNDIIDINLSYEPNNIILPNIKSI